ncbi:LOW QUALITY PROTEIN: cobalamin binding intrinsic factor [Manacus vitellinus]|uniref:LOW QUALITY PROTEIN: cobalamin binding intrinsic factor n=1 Tax=Manacus vitellinus TaxID=328815 RepID=UPI00115DBB2A|nr:LOW QUALITY PROTEIN: cobalamin binding intrinsic factor [Manacus vitellinus]
MTSGQVAEHVLALLSSCQDPRQVHALGQTIDLISILQQKTDEEMVELEDKGHPKTTLFSVSLDTMALCLVRADRYRGPAVALAKEVLSPNSPISVDTRAVAVLALVCAHDNVEDPEVQDLLHEAVWTVTNNFLDEQEERKGMIGNIYSMGLALQVRGWGMCRHSHLVPFPDWPHHLPPLPQALEASRDFYAPQDWDCAQAFAVVTNHTFELPMAIAQVLPALVGMSYLDAATLNCGAPMDLCPSLGTHRVPTGIMSPPGASQTPRESQDITVHYSITNNLQGIPWHYSISVTVPGVSTLLEVLERAEEMDPENFSFKTEQTSWGPFVVSIHGLAGSDNDRTYWQFLSSGKPLDQGGQSGKVGVMLGVSTSQPHISLCHRGRNLQTTLRGAHPGHLQHLLKPPRDPGSHQGAIKGHSSVSLCCVPGENRAQILFCLPSVFISGVLGYSLL